MVVDVVGTGTEEDALRELAMTLGIGHRVRFRGYVDEAELPDLYPQFDVLAVPSVEMPGWVEQFGRVVVEAQASGVPVVASESGASPDVVGDSGLLVAPGDPPALGAALARLLDEPELWERLHAAGPADARRCSWSEVAATQSALYRRVTGRSASTSR